ncbi:Fanconi anemia group M protein [Frankliniella fusca]|uniref:Fanconi anemia group M protein n=1 Tax=Frankliniella fusca TaxID=407009 RepID=A0AAE1H6V9_9NEOP|nr:Fanconi anemia group M protein [Frankliniella fusca]
MWDDDNDEELRRALEESARLYEEVELPRLSQQVALPCPTSDDGLPGPSTSAQTHVPRDTFKKPRVPGPRPEVDESELYNGPEAQGFDFKAGQVWVYPRNEKFPIRDYQKTCVETALFHNTLVSLPTGLGKTFIAAVVMYNFYMWYPKGKIIFMAPTKPLVAQQIENCINIMGIPESHTAEMTGATQSKLRAVTWKEKRVFFLTPQVVQNDLSANICPASSVKCVVIDEAHRALGDHAYAQVIRLLNSYDAKYRVLALSATPGSDLEAVQKVLSNLMISRIEVRTEDSADITKYTHERNLELMVVDVGPTINRIRVKFVGIAAGYAQRLQQRKLLFGSISAMPRFTVLKEWENFRREGANSFSREEQNKINTDFATVHMFVHGVELLNTYGLRLLLNHLKGAIEKKDAVANRLAVDEDLKALMDEIDGVLNPIELDDDEEDNKLQKKRYIYGHPKLDRLQEIVVAHFENFQKKGEATRAIVFCEYREGVVEICEMLKNYEPLVKPVAFMGQSVGKSTKGISQKQQLEIMDKFKRGLYNTLVSTSVGEEGLDIGEVDLIICFDAKNSPIRQVQRMGRTGRKRNGRIIMLVTRGKEEQKYNQGIFKKKNVRAVLLNRDNLANHLLDESPRMLPPGVQPKYTEIEIAETTSKPKTGQQDLRKMFMRRGSGNSGGSTKPSTGVRTTFGKVPHLSEDEFNELKMSWGSQSCYSFNKIPDKSEFWVKAPADIGLQVLLPSEVDLATYVEYMRFRQRTHIVGNSTDSDMLSDLLMWADERRDTEQGSSSRGFSSQITSSQLWPAKSKKRGRPAADGKESNQPKKRGRPRKDTNLNSPCKAQSNDDVKMEENEAQPLPVKPKCKPMFIEDDDDDDENNLLVSPEHILKTPSQQILPPKQISSSPASHPEESPMSDFEVICLDSEDDDNLDTSLGSTQLSTHPDRQDLFEELSKALQLLAMDEEDECNICSDLFPCRSFNKLVLESKKRKVDRTWNDVNKSLEGVLNFVPHLTKQVLAKQHTLAANSQRYVSLLPNPEIIAEDEMHSGMICGGIGDLSVSPFKPLEVPSQNVSFQRSNHNFLKKKISSPYGEKHIQGDVVNQIEAEEVDCKLSPKIEDDSEIKDQFEDMSLDFLGLSKFDDLLGSQENKETSNIQTHVVKEDPCLTIPAKDVKSLCIEEKSLLDTPITKDKSATNPIKEKADHPIKICTPPRTKQVISEQVSPILCSQQSAKPRPPLRLRKQPSRSEFLDVPRDTPSVSGEKEKGREKEKISDKEVTSSFPTFTSENNLHNINFDLFDDSLFPLSGEGNGNETGEESCNTNSVTVDEALKEAIRQKALEAKGKQHEVTFTQELRKMCETSVGGFTQILEMYDSKVKSPELRIERADSSSSLGKARQSCSPLNNSDDEMNAAKLEEDHVLSRSEEDLFADCDDEIFNNVDCVAPVTSSNLPESNNLNADINYVSSTKRNDQNASDPDGPEVGDAIQISDRSMSPIFRPSQNIRKPSKLSLKKKSSDKKDFENINHSEVETKLTIEQSQNNPSVANQPNSFSQIDFSLFGDEFNNSWLCSQEENLKTINSKKINELPKGVKPLDVETPKSLKGVLTEQKNKHDHNRLVERTPENEIDHSISTCTDQKSKWDDNQVKDKSDRTPENEIFDILNPEVNRSIPRDKTPENELDEAFATFDAAREVKRKSFDVASSSTPKVIKGQKFLEKGSKTSVGKSLSSSRFTLKTKWQPKAVNTGWIAAKSTLSDAQGLSEEGFGKNGVFNLSDFCDDSLLDVFDVDEKKGDNFNSEKECLKPKNQIKPSSSNCQGNKKKLSLAKRKLNKVPFGVEGKATLVSAAEHNKSEKDENVILLLSSDDEEIQHHKKGKKTALNVTSSSEDSFTLVKTNSTAKPSSCTRKRNREVLQSSSSSESVIEKNKKMSRNEKNVYDCTETNNQLNLSEFCDVSLLNEFLDDDERNGLGSIRNVENAGHSSDSDDFVQKKKHKTKRSRKKKKSSKKGNGFIVSEAEESSDANSGSSDGESSNLDELDSSFINDSQPEASQSVVDIHDKYLQSIRSPAVGRFKIPQNLPNVNMDVYSQYPDADELNQTYANDSFCVDDEPTQYEPEMSLLELAEARLKAARREKRKLKKASKPNNHPNNARNQRESDDSAEEVGGKRKRLKRIKVMEETIVEDNQPPTPESSPVVPHSENRGSESFQEPVDELAMLLDDDLDFSAIPDVSNTSNVSNIPSTRNEAGPSVSNNFSKFVKKTSFLNGGGHLKALESSKPTSSKEAEVPEAFRVPKQRDNSKIAASFTSIGHAISVNSKPASFPSNAAACSDVKTGASHPLSRILIIASAKQLSSSTDLIRVLRVNYNVNIVPRGGLDADFILSWRCGVNRVFSSDLKDRKRLEEMAKKLRESFMKPHVVIENDRIKSLATVGYQKKSKTAKTNPQPKTVDQASNTLSPWNSAASCANVTLLRQSGLFLLFSQNYDETAGFLAKLARKETNACDGIPSLAVNLPEEAENRLSFFSSLPGINLAFAIKLLSKYQTLEECSSVRDISVNLGVDVILARKIHNLLCEVHVSP